MLKEELRDKDGGGGRGGIVGKLFFIIIFRRVRKIAKSDCKLRHVCLSNHKGKLGSHRAKFYEIYLNISTQTCRAY